jgi:acyl-CoA synthetase (AMP-forming)/AMP-acid ligase II/aryl carrier-like protein
VSESHVGGLLEDRARTHAEIAAIGAPGLAPLTYAALARLAAEVHDALRAAGVVATDRVALVLSDGPCAATAFLAVAAAAAAAPLNPAYGRAELEFYLADLGPAAVVVPAGMPSVARDVARDRGIPVLELAPQDAVAGAFRLHGGSGVAAAAPGSRAPGDVALVLHTSGTTARPKRVPLTHANLCVSAGNTAGALGLGAGDRCLNVMPLFHVHGLIGALLSSVWAGATVTCTPGFQAPRFLDWLAGTAPTWYTAVPTMHQAIVERAVARGVLPVPSSLRLIRSCSAALAPSLMADLERVFAVPVIEAYGMTEAAHQIASNPLPPRPRKPGSVGVPAGPEVAALGPDGAVLGTDRMGEIAIRGPNVTSGYEDRPEANATAYVGEWFRTGDQGYVDADGYVFLTGRIKEMINSGGEKIAPREVDEVLLAHDGVAQALAFGLPDPRLGEVVAAAVVRRPGAEVTEWQLRQFVSGRLSFFKVPRRIVFVEQLPRGPTGKLQRIGLAGRLGLSAAPPMRNEAPVDARALRVAALAATVLEIPAIDPRSGFFDAGGDSVTGAALVARLREEFDAEVTLLDLFDAPSLAALSSVIRGRRPARATAPTLPPAAESFHVDGGRPPLVFLHAATEGDAFYCRALAAALGADQPFHAFAPLGLGGEPVPPTVEDIARQMLLEVRQRQPRGPYQLCGYCIGGPVVLEMARRLRHEGEAVGLVALIEPSGTHFGWRARLLERCLSAFGPLVPRERRARWVLRARGLAGFRVPPPIDSSPDSQRVRAAYHRAIASHIPRTVDAPVLLIRARDSASDPRWRRIGPLVDAVEVSGDHDTCVTVHHHAVAAVLAPRLGGVPFAAAAGAAQ